MSIAKLKKSEKSFSGEASKGDYADGTRPDADGETSGRRPVELPELVETVRKKRKKLQN